MLIKAFRKTSKSPKPIGFKSVNYCDIQMKLLNLTNRKGMVRGYIKASINKFDSDSWNKRMSAALKPLNTLGDLIDQCKLRTK
jgi:hypothetical protein